MITKATKTPLHLTLLVFAIGLTGNVFAQTTLVDVTFGSNNDGDGAFTHTGLSTSPDTTNTGTVLADSYQYRGESTGTNDTGFIRQFDGTFIDRTPDSGLIYTITGVTTLNDTYADDNNRIGMVLFSNPTTVLSRANTGHIALVWNLDDSSSAGSPGNNADDDFGIYQDYEGSTLADALVTDVKRDSFSSIAFAQDLTQGSQITFSTTFQFVGANIAITASMTDPGGTAATGTASVLAADYTDDYFGFVSAARARNYDGSPDPTGAARDNPLVWDYESFSMTVVPEPSSFALLALGLSALAFLRRRTRSS